MGDAKKIRLQPIAAKDANRLVRALHYSGKVTQNSQLHFGAFLDGRCGGVLSFGPSIDKRKTQRLVQGTLWNGFLELNRMAFAEWMPRNGESRALGIAMRLIRKHYPHIEWVVSFADATQCGDGTIYRAAGFVLTGVKRNSSMLRMPDGSVVADKTLNNHPVYNSGYWKKRGAKPLVGFQIRYIYFLNPDARPRLAVPELPYSAIAEAGASMYRGKTSARSDTSDTPGDQSGEGGAAPTLALSYSTGGGDA